MRVTKVWKNANFLNGEWTDHRVDSYWVEAGPNDVSHVLDLAPDPESLQVDIDLYQTADKRFYLLVAANLESIMCLPPHYPEAGQWNGYSPFTDIPPRTINNLHDVSQAASA